MRVQKEFTIKIFANDLHQTYKGRIGDFGQRSNAMSICSDINAFFAENGIEFYARVIEW